MKILVTIPQGEIRDSFLPDWVRTQLEGLGEIEWNPGDHNLSEDELAQAIKNADACITGWENAKFTEKVIAQAPRLRVIAHTGGTVASIVGEEVYDRGIKVLSGNELYAQSVAEGVLCYILTMLRKIPQFTNEMQTLGWVQNGWYNEGLMGQKVGLIGFGATARNTAELLRPFNCDLMICADHVSAEEAARYGARKATIDEIFSTCKVVSLHWALTPETYHQIDERRMRLLRPDALLVNTARGAIIDEEALARLLREKRFRAVLDVFEIEPLPMDSPLRGLDNVLLIPHMGGPTIDRRPFITQALLREIPQAMRGESSWLEIGREAMRRMTR